jgi:GDP-D-mannose 3', 5'-epimerase|tara:strand:+ start:7935 stop:8918 length:984 start_codon:yes stop_codon:yes gene_type:complete
MKKAIVLGAGGFIGSHMVSRLKLEGFYVIGVDVKYPEFSKTEADDFEIIDLTDQAKFENFLKTNNNAVEIYQYAADMGGAGFIFTGENDADIMHNSSLININLLRGVTKYFNIEKVKIFYSSSACIYPEEIQQMTENVSLKETDAYPANPDSEYGWEKLFSERLYLSYQKNYKMNTRIARFHNIYGPQGTWKGGREKVPAAVCRKVAEARNGENIEIWGDGEQARSFLYIEDCIEATRRLMESQVNTPINIGSEEMVTINQLVKIVAENANKKILVNHIDGPLGVRGRNSNNDLIRKELDWDYKYSLKDGIKITYDWISQQILNLNS